MLVLQILAGVAIIILGLIFAQLQQISSAITRVHHQLEYLGAPFEEVDSNWRSKGKGRASTK
jgi:sulfite exporter TauE/SafE